MRRLIALVVTAALLTSSIVAVAKGTVTQSTFRTSTDLVQVEVSVLDRDRRPVGGLAAADFTILEDGKPRPVSAFTAVDLPARQPTQDSGWPADATATDSSNALSEEGRLLVILMDSSIPVGFPSINARAVARAAVNRLRENDLAAIVHASFGEPQDFTGNHATLLSILDRTYPGMESSPEIAVQTQALEDELGETLARPTFLRETSGACYCGTCTHLAIQHIAEAIRPVSRRRKLILFLGTDFKTDVTDRVCGPIVSDALLRMFKAVDAANVTIDAVDVRGLQTAAGVASYDRFNPEMAAHALLQSIANLGVLPDHTGGRLIKNTNDPALQVPDLLRESESYYILGFVPARPPDGTRHKIDVKLRRRDVILRAPKVYVADKPAAPDWTAARQAWAATEGALPVRGRVTLRASATAVTRMSSKDPVVTIAVAAAHDGGLSGAGMHTVDAVSRILSMTGTEIAKFSQRIDVPGPSREAGLTYEFAQQFALRPGRYEVRTAVQDAAAKQAGSVYTYVDVPDVSKLPLFMTVPVVHQRGSAVIQGTNRQDVFPFLPTARRQFSRTDQADALVRVYRHISGALPVDVVVRVIDALGKPRLEEQGRVSTQAFDRDGGTDCTMTLPLASLEPGKYSLSFEARIESQFVRRQVVFEVLPSTTVGLESRPVARPGQRQ